MIHPTFFFKFGTMKNVLRGLLILHLSFLLISCSNDTNQKQFSLLDSEDTGITFNNKLTDCSDDQIKSVFDIISYNDGIEEDFKEAASFFATYRYMVVTGWFTSEVGMRDLGYKGNIPNVWDGVPEDVLKDHDVSYDEEWIAKCIDQSKRNETAVWDEDGNLLT